MSTKLSIVGAGGHCKVVIDALLQSGECFELSVYDSDLKKAGTSVLGVVVEELQDLSLLDADVFVAIGNNSFREEIICSLQECGKNLATIIHKDAVVAQSATIGAGSFVAALAVISASANLGIGVIVNHRAIVDHDCRVGNYSHIAPQVTLGGAVQIGDRVLVGASATVLPSKQIESDSIVGAGSVVTSNVTVGTTVVGNPAKVM